MESTARFLMVASVVSLVACAYRTAPCEPGVTCPQTVCAEDGVCREAQVLTTPDYYVTQEDESLEIPAWRGLLANDRHRGGGELRVKIVVGPRFGKITLEDDGSFVYAPLFDFFGDDELTYQASSGDEVSAPVRVSIRVRSVNDHDPVARPDTYVVAAGAELGVGIVAGVLANDADADGEALEAELESGPAHGLLQLRPSGSFRYLPNDGFAGRDSFTYRAVDGARSSKPVRVDIRVGAPEVLQNRLPAFSLRATQSASPVIGAREAAQPAVP